MESQGAVTPTEQYEWLKAHNAIGSTVPGKILTKAQMSDPVAYADYASSQVAYSLGYYDNNPRLGQNVLSELGINPDNYVARETPLPGQQPPSGTTSYPTDTSGSVNSTPVDSGAQPGQASSSPNIVGGVDVSTLPPELQQTLNGIQTYLAKLQANGQVVNPNLELTPEKLAEFTAQAQGEINPYYANQLKLARENLLAGAGYSANEIIENEKELGRKYNIAFTQIAESAADRGFALSGARVRDESNLATDTQNTIDANRRKLAFETGQNERTFAQAYGGSNIPDLQIGAAPTVSAGESRFTPGTGTRSLYTLDPAIYDSLVGSEEYKRRADVTNRVSQLTGAFNSNQALSQQRALTL